MRRAKIVCTIGPASEEVALLKKMMLAGMNVARMNFSHGTHEDHASRLAVLRQAAEELGLNIAVMLDTKGPEIRLGYLEKDYVQLDTGKEVCVTTDDIKGNEQILPVTYRGLPKDVKPGDRILISDGLVALRVEAIEENKIACVVENGGRLTSQKGVNVPGVYVNLPAITEGDERDIIFGVKNNFDFVAASFVRRANDVLTIRKIIEDHGGDMSIIAKIENQEAVNNLDEIIEVADAVMVARGDLGVEIAPEEVPLVQKVIIKKCIEAGKPVITATQMLESMIQNPRPTRAEASDVANAILDGTDAIMLSGETAAGKYPLEAVETMVRIATRTEASINYAELHEIQHLLHKTVTDAISHATVSTALDLEAAAIITSTESGSTAQTVSKYRPEIPIIAVTTQETVLRKLALVWGGQPLLVAPPKDTDSMIAASVDVSLTAGLIKAGDLVVITAGVPVGVHGTTNMLKVHTVSEIIARGTGIIQRSVTGKACVAASAQEALSKFKPGDILVTHATDRDFMPVVTEAAALITEAGGLTSHAAIVSLEFGIPVIVGIERAVERILDGELIPVDGQRGLVYKGVAKVL